MEALHAGQVLELLRIPNCRRFISGDHFGDWLARPFSFSPQLEHLGSVLAAIIGFTVSQCLEFDNSRKHFMFKGYQDHRQTCDALVFSLLCKIPNATSYEPLEKFFELLLLNMAWSLVQLQLTQGDDRGSLRFRRIRPIVSKLSQFINSLVISSDNVLNADKFLHSLTEPHLTGQASCVGFS